MFVTIWKYRRLLKQYKALQAAYTDLAAASIEQLGAFHDFRRKFEAVQDSLKPVHVVPDAEANNVVHLVRHD